MPFGTSVPSTSMSTFATSFPLPTGMTATSSPILAYPLGTLPALPIIDSMTLISSGVLPAQLPDFLGERIRNPGGGRRSPGLGRDSDEVLGPRRPHQDPRMSRQDQFEPIRQVRFVVFTS